MRTLVYLATAVVLVLLSGCGGSGGGGSMELYTITNGVVTIVANGTQFAGAVQSIVWGGKEFVNKHDHGRLFQTALQVDHYGECHNPTEAGCVKDVGTKKSTSVLKGVHLSADGTELSTEVQAASWAVNPDGTANCRKGSAGISQPTKTTISKRVRLNPTVRGTVHPRVIEWNVSVDCPDAKEHLGIEILTGYLPEDFRTVMHMDIKKGTLHRVTSWESLNDASDGYPDGSTFKGVSPLKDPVIWCTEDGSHAIGVIRPVSTIGKCEPAPSYEVFQFKLGGEGPDGNSCSKFSVVSHAPLSCFTHRSSFRVYLVVGSLQEVHADLQAMRSL